jgi:uncharacterized membrane protein
MLSGLLTGSKHGPITVRMISKYIINQAFVVLLLAVSIKLDFGLFSGLAAGLLLVPVTIMINGITEGLGITHNGFE